MDSIEEKLYQAIILEDQKLVSYVLSLGANPNKTVIEGKTCLGQAAYIGNTDIIKQLIAASKITNVAVSPPLDESELLALRKRPKKRNVRKRIEDKSKDKTLAAYRDACEIVWKSICTSQFKDESFKPDENQGYFVFMDDEGSSSGESRISSLKSPLSPLSLTPSPLADLEWDNELGTFAPSTVEDETFSSLYMWYATILEHTGASIVAGNKAIIGIDQQDAFTKPALHYAAEQGHVEVVKLLLNAGCKVDAVATGGLTALHVAATKDQEEVAKVLLAGGSNVNYQTYEKWTPLHYAAFKGFLSVVKVLVNNGAKLDARDTNDTTPLYLASGEGHVDVVRYLISKGANVNGEEVHGYTPLCQAVWQKCAPVVELLLKSGARITHSHKLLHYAIQQRHEEMVKLLAGYGGGLNLHDNNGDTPLLLATGCSLINMVKILLEKGANVNSRNSFTGVNVLHVAVENIETMEEFEELLKCLLEHDIDINAVTSMVCDTALNRALLMHRDEIAVILIRHGAAVSVADLHWFGLDHLSLVCRSKTRRLACMMIKAGHHLKIPDPNYGVPKQGSIEHWVVCARKKPLDLIDICRIKIRTVILNKNKNLFRCVAALPLPMGLKRFLMMEGEG